MIETLRKSVDNEMDILREISIFLKRMDSSSEGERKLLSDGVNSLLERMRTTNNLINSLVAEIAVPGANTNEEKTAGRISADNGKTKKMMPDFQGRGEILEELSINENLLRKLRKRQVVKEEEQEEFAKASGYLRIANKFFLETSDNLIKKGYFASLPAEIRKSNLDVLFGSYVAMILLTTLLFFFASLVLAVFLTIYGVSLFWTIWIPFIVPILVFVALYFYPSIEKGSISGRIDEELPFAVIHMSSISGSGIEPTEIFKIVALSKEYPFLRKEIRKILNQINVYGYDLVTALNNVSKNTSNPGLAELFAGLSTTISSGGSLSNFFEKRAESLLVSYKLEKEKSIKVAETSMDIYISVVIAAPMILMLMLIMISIAGIQIGFTPQELTFMTVGGVALINIVFLVYLQTKRTLY